jgi:hypothetical protein
MFADNAALRADHIPSANSPIVLTHLLELLASGVTSTRALHESLGIKERTVRYYRSAGYWLGFLRSHNGNDLTDLGARYVFNKEERHAIYREAVWNQPMIARLMAGNPERLPLVKEITQTIISLLPDIAPTTARRKASAVRALIDPAVGTQPSQSIGQSRQILLPFPTEATNLNPVTPTSDERWTGTQKNPATYRSLLLALTDYGELSLAQVRALLDELGAAQSPLGDIVDMAIERGDAVLFDGVLIITPAALSRSELLLSTASIALSHPPYRRLLSDREEAAKGDIAAARRIEETSKNFASWDQVLFNDNSPIDSQLTNLLLDRSLSSFPIAAPTNWQPAPPLGSFLSNWDGPQSLTVTLPPHLRTLIGGLTSVNAALRRAHREPNSVMLPTLATKSRVTYGGVLIPNERPTKVIPDRRTLRTQTLQNAPYPAMCAAILLAHRHRPDGVGIRRDHDWVVTYNDSPVGRLLDVLDSFAQSRGWVVSRRSASSITDSNLIDILVGVEIATVISNTICILSNRTFTLLREELEEMEILPPLNALGLAIAAHLFTKSQP